jgi:hypothetical protein
MDSMSGRSLASATGVTDWYGFIQKAELIFFGKASFVNQEYPYLVSWMYKIFGVNDYLVQLLNVVFSTMASYYVYKSLDLVHIRKSTITIVLFVISFSPFMLLYGAFFMREPIYFCSVTFSVYCFIRWVYYNKLAFFILSEISLIPAAYLQREGFAVGMILNAVLFLLYSHKVGLYLFNHKLNTLFIILLILITIPYAYKMIGQLGYGLDYIGKTLYNHNREGGGSQYLSTMNYNISLLDFILYTPIRLFFFFFSPVPWECRGVKDLVAFCTDSLVYFVFWFQYVQYLLKKRYRIVEKKISIIINMLVLFTLVSSVLFSWGTTTAGSAIRHRKVFILVLGVLYGILYDVNKKNSGMIWRIYSE